ncbi:MAG: flagellar basal-body rod protein FlgG [Rhodospirillaceae bacterium]|nr:flagellar basal-body rod protein FlgG [Rhodospirillaceae bacterium]
MRSLSIAATGMLAQQLNVEVISNNIANLNTTGFKRKRAEFADLLYQNLRRVGSASSDAGTVVPAGVQVGLGVKPTAVYRIPEEGNLVSTDNPLDIAINGRGYLQVELPTGETAYTRAGALQRSSDGTLVTADGYRVLPGITIPEDAINVTINATGEVLVKTQGQVAEQNIGQIQLALFPNEGGLEDVGDNLLLETTASGAPIVGTPGQNGFGTLQQGFLETSNVNVVSEITNLITAQRAYEMNSKVIQTSDEMLATLSQAR